jgi:hypothetical protein
MDNAGKRYGRVLRSIESAEPRTILGLLIKLLVMQEPDDEIDELADENARYVGTFVINVRSPSRS